MATPTAAATDHAEIVPSVIRENQDDVVEIPMVVPEGSEGTLTLARGSYEQSVGFRDVNGDGRVTVTVNTFVANQVLSSGSGYRAADPDAVTEVRAQSTEPMATGNYEIRLSLSGTEQDVALVRLMPSRFNDVRTRAAPNGITVDSVKEVEFSASVPGRVARDDTVILEFHAEGIAGVGGFDDPPGRELIYANTSMPSASATHTIQLPGPEADGDGDERGNASFSSVRIDYDNGDGGVPNKLTNVKLRGLGVDADGDGRIDRPVRVERRSVTRSGRLALELTDEQSLAESETLLIRYSGVKNPGTTGTDAVSVSAGDHRVEGTVTYGRAGLGQFGNALSVDVTCADSQDPTAPMPFEHVVSPGDDRLYLVFSTSVCAEEAAEDARLDVTLRKDRLRNGVPTGQTKRLSTSVRLVESNATLELSEGRTTLEARTQTLEGQTTLAPGSRMTIRVRSADEPSPQLVEYSGVVNENGAFRTRVDFSAFRSGSTVEVVPVANGRQIGDVHRVRIGDG
ncbi:hypothetical protein BRC83_10140 [Halobacteriales archaeon QS_1_68_17]|nr:MAG: hypothetical protein BRC83_10140 [Halobacteriales archaeon QS_1_68_17]